MAITLEVEKPAASLLLCNRAGALNSILLLFNIVVAC
jgi:hypothetical protein